MNMQTEHVARAECVVPVTDALAFLADGRRLGRWGLGSMNTVEVADGVVRGTSLFDGSSSYIRAVADVDAGTVTYHVGSHPEDLHPRIQARVAAAPHGCSVSLHAQRPPDMDDSRWLRLVRCHDVEILLIQAQLAALHPALPASPPPSPTPERRS